MRQAQALRDLPKTVSPVGPTHNTDDRKVFRVSPSNSIDHTEATHCEGDHTTSYSLGSGIAICCIASICKQHEWGQLQPPRLALIKSATGMMAH